MSHYNLASIIYTASLVSGWLLVAALMARSSKLCADVLLAALVFLLSLDIFLQVVGDSSVLQHRIPLFIHLLYAPLLYFYIKNSCFGSAFGKAWALHFLFFSYFQLAAVFSTAQVDFANDLVGASSQLVTKVHLVADSLIVAAYLAACIYYLSVYGYCFMLRTNMCVCSILVLALALYLAMSTGIDMGLHQSVHNFSDYIYVPMAGLVLLLVYLFLHRSVVQPVVPDVGAEKDEKDEKDENQKYGNNRLPDFVKNSILRDLHHYMSHMRPWLDFNLRLTSLADQLNVNPHQLSQIINADLGKTFASYVNEFRVKNACELLRGRLDKSITEIAFESGFSSKSSFNTIFKKQTGLTPSEYRKKYRQLIELESVGCAHIPGL